LPREGYKTITVSEEVYEKLDKMAKESFRTVPQYIEYLLQKILENKTKEVDCSAGWQGGASSDCVSLDWFFAGHWDCSASV